MHKVFVENVLSESREKHVAEIRKTVILYDRAANNKYSKTGAPIYRNTNNASEHNSQMKYKINKYSTPGIFFYTYKSQFSNILSLTRDILSFEILDRAKKIISSGVSGSASTQVNCQFLIAER